VLSRGALSLPVLANHGPIHTTWGGLGHLCWLRLSLLPIRPQGLSCRAAPSMSIHSLCHHRAGPPLSQGQHLAFFLAEFQKVPVSLFFQPVLAPLDGPVLSGVSMGAHLIWCCLRSVHSIISYRSLIKVLARRCPSTGPCNCPVVTNMLVEHNPLTVTLWV